jgi:DNA integrity scanning protein DisA with diadenylate cyclase activity
MVQFKALWLMVRGLLSSFKTMACIVLILFIVIYVFACLSMEMITKGAKKHEYSPGYHTLVDTYFPGLGVTMLTLVQFLTMDSVGGIYQGMIPEQPFFAFYSMSFIVIVSIVLMNLVTAVIVESSLEQANQDKEMRKAHEAARVKKIIPAIQKAFEEMDEDGDGTLTLVEVMGADPKTQALLETVVEADSLEDLFEFLDEDGSGEVTVEEFCEGLVKVATQDAPIELVQIRAELRKAKVHRNKMSGDIEAMAEKVGALAENIGALTTTVADGMARLEAEVGALRGKPPAGPTGMSTHTGADATHID